MGSCELRRGSRRARVQLLSACDGLGRELCLRLPPLLQSQISIGADAAAQHKRLVRIGGDGAALLDRRVHMLMK